jgi:hypothetical protein
MATEITQEGDYRVTRVNGVIISRELHRPPEAVIAPSIDTSRLIDLGPFFDRFGAAMMPVLMSTNPAVAAIRENLNARKWVDLSRPDVTQSLAFVGSVVAELTPELRATIINSAVTQAEQMALIKTYFT